MKTIFTSLDFDIAKNGRKCTHPCGSKKSPLSTLKDWCYTDEGNEKWEYCIKGNYQEISAYWVHPWTSLGMDGTLKGITSKLENRNDVKKL